MGRIAGIISAFVIPFSQLNLVFHSAEHSNPSADEVLLVR